MPTCAITRTTIAAAPAFALAGLAGATDLAHTAHAVEAPDGTVLAVQEWGAPEGPTILFIHGFSQSHLSWTDQVADPPLAARFRMVTFDQRGSGMSGKPRDAGAYASERIADDVAAIIAALGLEDPVLVASSAGGLVIADYLAHHGQDAIAGVKLVGAVVTRDPDLYGPATAELPAMVSGDLATSVRASIRFASQFFAEPPDEALMRETLAAQAMTPPEVRALMLAREGAGPEVWDAVTVPVTILHGQDDAVIKPAMAEAAARLMPHATLSMPESLGHFPFREDPKGFNAALADFVLAAAGVD